MSLLWQIHRQQITPAVYETKLIGGNLNEQILHERYDIDSDDEMLIGAIDDDTLLNYKGAISPSDHTDTNVSDIKKITLNSASRLRYDLNFIKDGISVPLGDYLTGLSSRIYYTKADKIVSKAEKQWDSEVTNSITIQDTVPNYNHDVLAKYLLYAFSTKYHRDCCRSITHITARKQRKH